jgi:hypothetical protein
MNNNSVQPGFSPAGDPMVAVSAASLHTTIDTLARFEQFFRHHASHTTLADLRTYCAVQGWHGACATQALLDDLGLHAFALRHALDTAPPNHDRS